MRQDEKKEERMLITEAKQGNVEAFERLVKKHQRSIYYLCLRMTGSHSSADDLSQETFVKAYFAMERFKDGRDFFPWIRKIAVNSSLRFLQVTRREEPLGDRTDRVPAKASEGQELPHNLLQKSRMVRRFQEALEALPPDQKAVFMLRVFENRSYKDIARILGLSPGTVMSRLSRARKKLREEMADYLERRHR